MNALVKAMQKDALRGGLTHNMAESYRDSGSDVLNFFSKSGAIRAWSAADQFSLFHAALLEDPLLAMRALFYARDIRGGGQGERDLFRTVIRELTQTGRSNLVRLNLHLIPEYGRWDDAIYALYQTSLWGDVLSLVNKQLIQDLRALDRGEGVSLLGKWLPSEQASNKHRQAVARTLATNMGFTMREYRKTLSALRKAASVTERWMSAGRWDQINFSNVSSQAGRIYRKAFWRHQAERYAAFLKAVERGEVEIKAGTLSAVELVHSYRHASGLDRTIEAQFAALPDLEESILAVADVSGSMNDWNYYHRGGAQRLRTSVRPIDVAVAMALYTAMKARGPYQGLWLTFSNRPQIQRVKSTLLDSLKDAVRAHWDMNTDLQAALDLVLRLAVENNARQEDLPKILLIISDMQFDRCARGTNLEAARRKFENAGYTMPTTVFWNVNAYGDSPATMHDSGVVLLSGYTQSVLQSLLGGLNKALSVTPYSIMLEVLNSERYAPIRVA